MKTEEIKFYGHKNVLSLHPRTIEITMDRHLTLNGDCIIGVKANKACCDIRDDIKQKLRTNNAYVEFQLIVEPYTITIIGLGNSELKLDHKHDIVMRKSNFICSRTICLNSNLAAVDLPRQMVDLLRDPDKKASIRIMVD